MSQTSNPNAALVQALQKKCNHQAERINELEETIAEMKTRLEMVEQELAEVDDE